MAEPRIARLRTFRADVGAGRTWLFVVVETNNGERGVGEASQSRLDGGLVQQIHALEPAYVGQDPRDLIERRALALPRADAHRIFFAASSALDQALWDLVGQLWHAPVYQLLGGSVRDSIRLYANVSLACGDGSPAAYATAASEAVGQGFTAVKVNAFDALPALESDKSGVAGTTEAGLAIRRVAAVRDAIGDDVELLVDLSFRVAPADAPWIVEELAAFHPYWIEEPFYAFDPARLAQLRSVAPMRLAGGEQLSTRWAFRRVFEAGSLDVIMPDVKWIGGISEARKVAAMADAFGIEVAPHNMSGPVATAASLQIAISSPSCTFLEYCWGVPEWRNALVGGGEQVANGLMARPTRSGLGVTLDLEAPYLQEV